MTDYEEYQIKKRLDDALLDLRVSSRKMAITRHRSQIHAYPRRHLRIPISLTPTHSETEEALFIIGAIDILLFGFAAIFLMVPFILPYEIGFVFGIALLLSLLTRSILARLATLIFTVVYFLLMMTGGVYFGLGDLVNFALGNNYITYVPYHIGTLLVILAMGAGVAYGISSTTKLAGLWVVMLSFIIATADTLVGYFLLGIMEWELVFTTRFTIYLVAILIAWGIFYLSAKSIRWGITTAVR